MITTRILLIYTHLLATCMAVFTGDPILDNIEDESILFTPRPLVNSTRGTTGNVTTRNPQETLEIDYDDASILFTPMPAIDTRTTRGALPPFTEPDKSCVRDCESASTARTRTVQDTSNGMAANKTVSGAHININTTSKTSNTCPESHVGQYCQHISPCYTGSDISKRCLNQGTCQVIFRGTSFVSTETPPSFQCQCRLGYSASLCEIPLATVCDRAPCQNGGTCQLNGSLSDFTCRCRRGYRGATCTEVDYCQSRPCNNSGKCRSLQSGYVCHCLAGFEGPTCTQDINECLQGQVCQHGGTCINTIGSYRCACRPGYSGQDCQSLYVPCSPNHCLNGGRCYQDETDRYLAHCDCPPGYVGKACEINYDDCKDNQCMNGATCLDGLNNYSCQCPPTYMGVYCTEDVDECGRLPVRCKNGATCINSRGGYSCICVNSWTSWTGKHCDQNINDCTALVCLNGGTCHDRVSSYYCECPPGKTGFQCQLDDACASQPCKEGSLCDTNPTDGSYSCFQCRPGFNGTDCSQDINECEMASGLCAHDRVCRNTPGSFVCDCPKGLTGSRCEMNINECASNPCQNDGTCLDMRGEYRCMCIPGYTGVNCQTDIDECSLSPCQNGGICRDSRGPESFKCQCPSGFGGAFCEENLRFNQCLSAPCQAGGTCVNGVGGFTCQCRSGYSGKTCEKSESPIHAGLAA